MLIKDVVCLNTDICWTENFCWIQPTLMDAVDLTSSHSVEIVHGISVDLGFHSSKGVAVSSWLLILCWISLDEHHVHLPPCWTRCLCPWGPHVGAPRSRCCTAQCQLSQPMFWHPRCNEFSRLFSGRCKQCPSPGSGQCCKSPDGVDDQDVASSMPLLLALNRGTVVQSRAKSGVLRTTIDVEGLFGPLPQSWLGRWMSRPIHCPKCRTVQLFCPCSCHWCVEGSTHLLCCLFWRQHVEDSTGLQLHLWIGVSTTENVDAAWRNALHLLESVDLPTQWD